MAYLSEISGSLVGVNFLSDLVVSWQRVHNNHMLLCVSQGAIVDNKTVLQLLVRCEVFKSLLLNASAVQDVASGHNLFCELCGNDDLLAGLRPNQCKDFRWQGKELRRDELDRDIVVLEKLDERVDCTTISEVANERDGQSSDSTKLFPNGE